MSKQHMKGILLASICAGTVNGLFGAGGGMVLVPLLDRFSEMDEQDIFPVSISMILPICLTSLTISAFHAPLPFGPMLPYLLGSSIGGVLAGVFGKQIPTLWLHRVLGILILWGGIRYLW